MANPSVILVPTNITPGDIVPSIPAGINRIVFATIVMTNGGGTCNVPTSVTCNGKTATRVAGDPPTAVQTRLSCATYAFIDADISSIVGSAIVTAGQTGTAKAIYVSAIQDAKQGAPSATAYQYVASGTGISYPLTRLANSLTLTLACNSSGNLTSLTNPTKTGYASFHCNYAYANDTATTATVTTNSSGYISAHTMNFEYASAVSVDSINDSSISPVIDVGAINTATSTGLGTITSISVSDGARVGSAIPNMPSGDGDFAFSWPYADGVTAPRFGAITATFGDVTNSAAMSAVLSLPSSYSSVTWSGATDLSQYHLGHVLTLTNGNYMHYPNADGVVFNPDGSFGVNPTVTFPYVINGLLQDATTGVITRATITVSESGSVSVTTNGLPKAGICTAGIATGGLFAA